MKEEYIEAAFILVCALAAMMMFTANLVNCIECHRFFAGSMMLIGGLLSAFLMCTTFNELRELNKNNKE